MKLILAGMFTLGTAFASYNAYKADQFAPLLAEIRRIRLPFPQVQTTPGSANPQTGFSPGYTDPQSQAAVGSAGFQAGFDPGYAGPLFPHLQAAFSPLETNSAKLAEEPLLRLREIVARDHETAEAREAIRLLDQLRALLRERELYRARFEDGARRFDGESVRNQIAHDWLARVSELAPSYQRAYADLFAHEEESRRHGGQVAQVRESYAEMARRDPYTKPRFEEHADYGSVAHRETAHSDPYRNPLEQNRNPLEEHRNSLAGYHSPLEQNSGHPAVGNANSREPSFEGSRQTSITRPVLEEHSEHGTTAPNTHYTNPFAHPISKPPPVAHPPPVTHTNPPPVVRTN